MTAGGTAEVEATVVVVMARERTMGRAALMDRSIGPLRRVTEKKQGVAWER
jgi:hypothetical protein